MQLIVTSTLTKASFWVDKLMYYSEVVKIKVHPHFQAIQRAILRYKQAEVPIVAFLSGFIGICKENHLSSSQRNYKLLLQFYGLLVLGFVMLVS